MNTEKKVDILIYRKEKMGNPEYVVTLNLEVTVENLTRVSQILTDLDNILQEYNTPEDDDLWDECDIDLENGQDGCPYAW